MKNRLEVNDEVVLSEAGKLEYDDYPSNPHDTVGILTGHWPESEFYYRVRWDNGQTNSYRVGELEPAKGNKQMKLPYTMSGESITVFIGGSVHVIPRTDINFSKLTEALKEDTHDEELIKSLVSKEKILETLKEGNVEVTGNTVTYLGEPVHNSLQLMIMELLEKEFDVRPWMKLMDNIMMNPSYKSRASLYDFLSKWSAPITEDGHFIAFKNVRSDFKDIHSGTFDNSPGAIVEMDRSKVNDDSNQTCSAGLHVCATSYLGSFYRPGGKTVAVKVNPVDVVSVPHDYNHAKMRTCKYEVLNEVTKEEVSTIESSPVYEEPDVLDVYYNYDYDYDEYDSYEDSYDSYDD